MDACTTAIVYVEASNIATHGVKMVPAAKTLYLSSRVEPSLRESRFMLAEVRGLLSRKSSNTNPRKQAKGKNDVASVDRTGWVLDTC